MSIIIIILICSYPLHLIIVTFLEVSILCAFCINTLRLYAIVCELSASANRSSGNFSHKWWASTMLWLRCRLICLRPNLFNPYPVAYKLKTCFDHHSIFYSIWTVNPSGGRMVIRSVPSTVERTGSCLTVGAVFFGNENWVCWGHGAGSFLRPKTEYVEVTEQAHSLGPAYSTPFSIYKCRDTGLWLLHAIIHCLCCMHDALRSCFYAFWPTSFIILVKILLLLFLLYVATRV